MAKLCVAELPERVLASLIAVPVVTGVVVDFMKLLAPIVTV
jgi:hypothetical protein